MRGFRKSRRSSQISQRLHKELETCWPGYWNGVASKEEYRGKIRLRGVYPCSRKNAQTDQAKASGTYKPKRGRFTGYYPLNVKKRLDIQTETPHIPVVMEATADVTPSEMRLNELPPRTCAIVCRIETEGEDIQRLKTLGVCVGRQIEVIKRGDPLIIRVFSSRLGMSASLAAHVWLAVCTPDHCAMRKQSLK